ALFVLCVFASEAFSQFDEDPIGRDLENNVITTAVPFLIIAPDTRAGAMGDAGVATSPDPNSQHWNPAKYVFAEDEMGIALSYTPWLRNIIDDMNLAYLAGYYRLDNENMLSASLMYFDMGEIPFRDYNNQPLKTHQPNEFALDVGYSRLLGQNFSGAVALRYIRSDLTGGIEVGGVHTNPGQSVAGDVAFFYTNDDMGFSGMNGLLNWGINISNIGAKMSYSSNENRDFIPTNFRTGVYYQLEIDEYNKVGVALDMNKLLVPTPPVYYSAGEVTDAGDTIEQSFEIIKAGKDDEISVPSALFQSWYDAPGPENGYGSVVGEEFAEISWSIGAEYWYSERFALRAGYFLEHQFKGARKYFTLGAGMKLNVFGLDFAYLIPTGNFNTSPLANTLRFTLTFDLGAQEVEG
ncbi:MAG: type IX secretion system outer membrane channel protein PorV, partial [Candidatus Delongbacteria bacterium]|nr:type IX secretion system outer membrane channel protein PorV [Candidatus Delongbacteria bacterium]